MDSFSLKNLHLVSQADAAQALAAGGAGGGGGGAGGAGGHGAGAGGKGTPGGGEDSDSDGRGPQYGKPEGSRGKPSWAQEGIPEVELGRLNVARSPSNVIDHARSELLSHVDDINLAAYTSVEAYIAYVTADWDAAQIIDSPLENLAVLRDAINGVTTLPGVPVSADLISITLGTASDKTVSVSADTVTAVVTILGGDPSSLDVDAIAADAEAVRDAIEDAHG